ncbi:hypothetical protein M011DRAFT_332489 [Sporormia fimetaria CBS 119925]|uniref:Uncharacterized protein n=1 Tax=Sporormia fimetaria CBS 119925 TaxID=1340428 RepID=A0A6A6VGB2_9PLEO|nr:hypothetical protein M011DRAFT_332489 [Sporormia fimetaria CBS 119925]
MKELLTILKDTAEGVHTATMQCTCGPKDIHHCDTAHESIFELSWHLGSPSSQVVKVIGQQASAAPGSLRHPTAHLQPRACQIEDAGMTQRPLQPARDERSGGIFVSAIPLMSFSLLPSLACSTKSPFLDVSETPFVVLAGVLDVGSVHCCKETLIGIPKASFSV